MRDRRVLAIDDHPIALMAMRSLLLELDSEIELVEASSVAEALALERRNYRFILLDMQMPGLARLDALAAVLQGFEGSPVIVVSSEEDPRLIRAAIDRGAAGYIPKSTKTKVMLEAMRLVLAQGIYVPPAALLSASSPSGAPAGQLAAKQLSDRQREALQLALQGCPNKLIARELRIEEGTVKAHLSTAYRVLGVRNRTEALYVVMQDATAPRAER